jgi:hypothetical protein
MVTLIFLDPRQYWPLIILAFLDVFEISSREQSLELILIWMEQHIFYIGIDYRGHHWKGIAIYNANVVILHQWHLF